MAMVIIMFVGVQLNQSLQLLDVSYNHLGPVCAEAVPPAVRRHPTLHSLNLAGNNIGQSSGPQLIFALAGFPLGVKYAEEMQLFVSMIRNRQMQGLKTTELEVKSALALVTESSYDSPLAQLSIIDQSTSSNTRSAPSTATGPPLIKLPNTDGSTAKASQLTSLSFADNQLGPFCGFAIASLIERNKTLTHLDVSGNALGYQGRWKAIYAITLTL